MSTIITRNSATSGSIPSSLIQGELAINVTNNRLFYGSGSGNVVTEFGVTSSYALNAGTSTGGSGFSITSGSVTASVNLTNSIFLIQSGTFTPFSVSNLGSTVISGSATDLFLIKNTNNQNICRFR